MSFLVFAGCVLAGGVLSMHLMLSPQAGVTAASEERSTMLSGPKSSAETVSIPDENTRRADGTPIAFETATFALG
jgi:hypothetical protein